jgi:hypothetical protein
VSLSHHLFLSSISFLYSRCQLLSCTSDRVGKKNKRKNRLRAFPNEWNDITKEHQDEIRRSLRKVFLLSQTIKFDISFLEIPSDVQRCCVRCFDKVSDQVRQRQNNPNNEEEDDDTITINRTSKHNDGKRTKKKTIEIDNRILFSLEEWSEAEIHALTQAVEKYNHDWPRVAECVHRSEESCRAFYLKRQRKNISPSDDHVTKNLDV